MARNRKTEPDIILSPATTAPGRRKAATAPRQPRATASKAPAAPIESERDVTIESVVILYAPANEEIAALAYSYWVTRGYSDGCPEEDWLRAERELHQRAQ